MFNLKDKVALVTGASGERGLGRAIALKFAEQGSSLVVSDLFNNESDTWGGLAAVVEEITSIGQEAISRTADVTDSSAVDRS